MIKVLIIDDEPQIAGILDSIITGAIDCEVTKAYSCEEAYRMLARQHTDLVFLDINLKDGTGYDVLKKIPDSDTKVVMMSAVFTEPSTRPEHGWRLFIEKPFTKETVVNSLKALSYL